jgi:hypothetical protein
MSNKDIEKCKKKVCGDSYMKKQKELSKSMLKRMLNHTLNKKNVSEEEKKKSVKNLKSLNKMINKIFEKEKESLKQKCADAYCNPKCKDTIFENGKNISKVTKKKIINEFKKKNPSAKKTHTDLLLSSISDMRKSIFKNKTSVLKDNFYEGYNQKTVKSMKKKGALSGCSLISGI